jgi:hypothetical protein
MVHSSRRDRATELRMPLRHTLAMPCEWFIRYPLTNATTWICTHNVGKTVNPTGESVNWSPDISFGALFRSISG